MEFRFNIEKIEQFMESNHLTKKEFSERCGFSITTLNKLFSGQTNFRMNVLYKLSQGMDVKMQELISW